MGPKIFCTTDVGPGIKKVGKHCYRPLGRACGKCDTSKGRTDKVRGRLALVKLKV